MVCVDMVDVKETETGRRGNHICEGSWQYGSESGTEEARR